MMKNIGWRAELAYGLSALLLIAMAAWIGDMVGSVV